MEPDFARLYSALSQLPCPSLALELGCGDDPAVAEYFVEHCLATRFVAIDHDLAALKRRGLRVGPADPGPSPRKEGKGAMLDFSPAVFTEGVCRLGGDIVLVHGSIAALPFAARFDLIVARHPDIDRQHAEWQRAISRLPDYLAPGGHVVVTAYSIPEADQLHQWLSAPLGDEIHFPRLAPPAISGRDRFVLCYRLS